MTAEYKKCFMNGKFIKPCKTLDSKLNDYDSRGKGLNFMVLKDMETFERTRDLICYRMKAKDKGLILNFCPWCGEQIHKEF